MRILFPVAEVMGIYKIGGLGDVGAALPKALNSAGHDVRIVLPKHPEIEKNKFGEVEVATFEIRYKQENLSVVVEMCYLPGTSVPVYMIGETKYLSSRSGASDNHADKFSVFSLCIAEFVVNHLPHWQPQIIHCHDWHTALVPVILRHKYRVNHYKYIITIHNLAYQGVTKTAVLQHLELPETSCKILSWDMEDGDLNILLEGILHADRVTTVSPTYALEILTDLFGEKINQVLQGKNGAIMGILNGLDVSEFDPQSDINLDHKFNVTNWREMRSRNRGELRNELGLNSNEDVPLIGYVGRVDPYQKGIGLFIDALNQKLLPPENCQFVFLGCGDMALESQLHQVASHADVRIITRFDERLARRIYASAHLMMIPSRFEPCGLVQLIAMRYGALPVARAVGGLKDTITDGQTGYLFEDFDTLKMMECTNRAIRDIEDDEKYGKMVDASMKKDWSWGKSAQAYINLYQNLMLEY